MEQMLLKIEWDSSQKLFWLKWFRQVIFAQVFLGFWLAVIAMVALTAAAIATSSPFQANRFRNVSVDDVRGCAQHELELYKTGTKRALSPSKSEGI